jgi:hypothetical protein
VRTVFEFYGKNPSVSGFGDVYAHSIKKRPTWPGVRISLLIVDADQPRAGQPYREGDAIEVEGDGEAIRKALRDALSMVDFIERHARKQFEEETARSARCPQCGCWIQRMESGAFPPHYAVLKDGSPPCPEGRSHEQTAGAPGQSVDKSPEGRGHRTSRVKHSARPRRASLRSDPTTRLNQKRSGTGSGQ